MPLIDDLSASSNEQELERRRFLGLVGSGALGVSVAGTAVTAVQYISPNVLYEEDTRFKVGTPDSFPVGTVLALGPQKVYVVRTEEGFFALSAVCTHLGCMTRYEADQKSFFCPCHGSRFSAGGDVVGGPAPRALPRIEVALEGGVLVVDSRKLVPPGTILKV
ncbi:MAG: ubiquinol-cytochrome c reductase iron-sulfur subunit [Planctomycetes bacterium]|nr:ubiquinol-cytochrome c reductase iron-sulfur subunit [Planctomycetota bacterium]